MQNNLTIDGREIGADFPPYFIAELSNNHLGDINRCYQMIDVAVEAGADAVKIQTYSPDSLTIDCDLDDFIIEDPLWRGKSYYKLYSEIHMPLSWTEKLFNYAANVGVTFFSSPFDSESVELLKGLNAPAFKIASFEAVDPNFVRMIAKQDKPVIISAGICDQLQLKSIQQIFKYCKNDQYAILHCVSSYPANIEDYNVASLKTLKQYSSVVGLSDHSLSNTAVNTAIALGARIIEKHFTLDRNDGGPDAAFSLQPEEFKQMVHQGQATWQVLGHDHGYINQRKGSHHGRSIYIVKDVQAGELVSEDNIRVIRPGFGMDPKYYDEVIGAKFSQDFVKGTRLTHEAIVIKENVS